MPTKYKSGLGLGTQATPHIQNIEVGDWTPYDNKAELTQAFSLENWQSTMSLVLPWAEHRGETKKKESLQNLIKFTLTAHHCSLNRHNGPQCSVDSGEREDFTKCYFSPNKWWMRFIWAVDRFCTPIRTGGKVLCQQWMDCMPTWPAVCSDSRTN